MASHGRPPDGPSSAPKGLQPEEATSTRIDTSLSQIESFSSNTTSRSSTDVTISSFGDISRVSTSTTTSTQCTLSSESSSILEATRKRIRHSERPEHTPKTEHIATIRSPASSPTLRPTKCPRLEHDAPRGLAQTYSTTPSTVPGSTTFYSALPLLSSLSIRLLRLHPETAFDAELQGDLYVAKLDDGPRFEALSYTWGAPFEEVSLPAGTIHVSQQDVTITGNLDHALRRLRHQDRPRDLWIDSLCIDQTAPKERRYQIDIMEQIYSAAQRVLAWLGEDSSQRDGKYIFDFCNIIESRGARPHYRNVAKHRDRWPDHKALSRDFASRRYFKRRWIVQEVCHANEVLFICGEHSATLSVFCAALQKVPASRRPLEKMKEFGNIVSHLRSALADWRQQQLRSSQSYTLSDFIWMLQRFHDFKCSDDRDRVYAIASLWKGVDVPQCKLKADYELTCEQLYLDFARRFIQAHLPDTQPLKHMLTIAAEQACNGRSDPGDDLALPSWIVDWRLDPAPRIGPDDVHGSLEVPSFDLSSRQLKLKTHCYGKIVEASGHYRDWILLSSDGLKLPSHSGSLSDEDYVEAMARVCPALKEGDVLVQPVSTYWARKGHVGDAAMLLRPVKQDGKVESHQIIGRCPLDLFWSNAQGDERTTSTILTDPVVVIIE